MKKKVVMLVVLLLILFSVGVGCEEVEFWNFKSFFEMFDKEEVVEEEPAVPTPDYPLQEDSWEEIVQIEVLEEGFSPKVVEISAGQTVIWMNKRKTKTFIVGMRELDDMRSKFLEFGEVFSWRFDEPGTYTYVDSIVIGKTGKVIVK